MNALAQPSRWRSPSAARLPVLLLSSCAAMLACSPIWAPSPELLRRASVAPARCELEQVELFQRQWSPQSYAWRVHCGERWLRCSAATAGRELSAIACAPDRLEPLRLLLSAQQARYSGEVQLQIQVAGSPQFAVLQGEAVCIAAGQTVASRPVAFALTRRVCMGCDPVPGGGPDQCANRCWNEAADPLLHLAGLLPAPLDPAVEEVTIALRELRPVCDGGCEALARQHRFDRALCLQPRDPPCRSDQPVEAAPALLRPW